MPGKGSKSRRIEDELAELRALSSVSEPEAVRVLRRALRERASLVAERAAVIARDRSLTALEGDLVHAFDRFQADPVKRDPGCRAKLAALEALDFLDAHVPQTFLQAALYVQLEPQWGKPADTAAPVRARAILALARRGHEDLPLLAGELLVDAEWPVRQAAAEAIGVFGERGPAGALLAVLAGAREDEPQVITTCMQSVLLLAPDWALPRLRNALAGSDEIAHECALVALAQSGRDNALREIVAYLETEVLATRRDGAIRALGLHRSDGALTALLDFIANGSLSTAKAAVAGLSARRFDIGVRARAAAAVRTNGAKAVTAAFDEIFHDVPPTPT